MPLEPADPRIERTRVHVLAHAREMLASHGPAALTYSALAKQARVTRQTLYRHWPSQDALLVDLVLEQSMAGMPADVTGSPDRMVAAFLYRLRDDMNDPAHVAPLTALIAQADHDEASSQAVRRLRVDVLAALNEVLAPTGTRIGADDYDRLCGAVLFRRLVAREPVTDAYIDALVAAWSADEKRPDQYPTVRDYGP